VGNLIVPKSIDSGVVSSLSVRSSAMRGAIRSIWVFLLSLLQQADDEPPPVPRASRVPLIKR